MAQVLRSTEPTQSPADAPQPDVATKASKPLSLDKAKRAAPSPVPPPEPEAPSQPSVQAPPAPVSASNSAGTSAPIDETDERFLSATNEFRQAYQAWSQTPGNPEHVTKLQESMHELRRVLARVEITLASSTRDDRASSYQIPAPGHRARNRMPPR